MRLSMKVTLLFLSLLIAISCDAPDSNSVEKQASNEVLIDSIIRLSKSWSDSLDRQVQDIGEKINAPFSFLNIGNTYYPGSIVILCNERKDARRIERSELLQEMSCANDRGFIVCHKKTATGHKLRYSLRPHPTLNWVFRIERVN